MKPAICNPSRPARRMIRSGVSYRLAEYTRLITTIRGRRNQRRLMKPVPAARRRGWSIVGRLKTLSCRLRRLRNRRWFVGLRFVLFVLVGRPFVGVVNRQDIQQPGDHRVDNTQLESPAQFLVGSVEIALVGIRIE